MSLLVMLLFSLNLVPFLNFHPVWRKTAVADSSCSEQMAGSNSRSSANSKHWFTTSFLQRGGCRKAMLGVWVFCRRHRGPAQFSFTQQFVRTRYFRQERSGHPLRTCRRSDNWGWKVLEALQSCNASTWRHWEKYNSIIQTINRAQKYDYGSILYLNKTVSMKRLLISFYLESLSRLPSTLVYHWEREREREREREIR